MGTATKIQWAHHTLNPWRGCTKVSPGCSHCYAEAGSKRNPKVLGVWGREGTREIAAESQWRLPPRWDRWARDGFCWHCGGRSRDPEAEGRCRTCDGLGSFGRSYRARVFCASLADVFEGRDTMPAAAWPAVEAARVRLFGLIDQTDYLDWLLLTKRPQEIVPAVRRLRETTGWAVGWRNVWLGTSVEDQQRADERIPELLAVPAMVRFLSCEPLLGPLDLSRWLASRLLHWVIVGGESGGNARVFDVAWAEEIVNQCAAFGVACFVKQLGARVAADGRLLQIGGRKGEDLADWPEHLQVRQMPGGLVA
jgi:protein gp37